MDRFNATDKRMIFHLMATVQLPDSGSFGSQMAMHTVTGKKDVSLEMEFQKHLSPKSLKRGAIYHRKHKKRTSKKM